MKIIIIITIILLFGVIGYYQKQRYKKQKEMLLYIKEFVEFYQINVDLYNNNLVEIINKYIIMQNNKNAYFNNIFTKYDNIYIFNTKTIDDYIIYKNIRHELESLFNDIGKRDKNNEIKMLSQAKESIDKAIQDNDSDEKIKGDLYFKIWLAVGIVIAILVW